MTPDLQSTLDAIDDLAVHRCGQCDTELGPDAPSSLFCSPEHQEAFYAARSEALVGYREPVELAAHVDNQWEEGSPETTPRGIWQMLTQAMRPAGEVPPAYRREHQDRPGPLAHMTLHPDGTVTSNLDDGDLAMALYGNAWHRVAVGPTGTTLQPIPAPIAHGGAGWPSQWSGVEVSWAIQDEALADTQHASDIGREHPLQWWLDRWPSGNCPACGGQCDGDECGLHAAGCVFGGPDHGAYWLVAHGCDLWHGETLAPLSFIGFRPGDADLLYSNAGARYTPPRRRIDSRGSR